MMIFFDIIMSLEMNLSKEIPEEILCELKASKTVGDFSSALIRKFD